MFENLKSVCGIDSPQVAIKGTAVFISPAGWWFYFTYSAEGILLLSPLLAIITVLTLSLYIDLGWVASF